MSVVEEQLFPTEQQLVILLAYAVDIAFTASVESRNICAFGGGDALYIIERFNDGTTEIDGEIGGIIVAFGMIGFIGSGLIFGPLGCQL